jgi:hypothetical protein
MNAKILILTGAAVGFGWSLGLLPALPFGSAGEVERRDERTYIVDRRGERWDITEAVSLGFRPSGFRHGIGRYAFTPLDDSHVRDGSGHGRNERVIGIAEGGEAKAFSVRKLSRHEIANSRIGDQAIAAAY